MNIEKVLKAMGFDMEVRYCGQATVDDYPYYAWEVILHYKLETLKTYYYDSIAGDSPTFTQIFHCLVTSADSVRSRTWGEYIDEYGFTSGGQAERDYNYGSELLNFFVRRTDVPMDVLVAIMGE